MNIDEKFNVPPVRVSWQSQTERIEGEFPNSMVVAPDSDGQYRVYFVGQSLRELGRMAAVVVEMAATNANGLPLEIALEILKRSGEGEYRATPYVPKSHS